MLSQYLDSLERAGVRNPVLAANRTNILSLDAALEVVEAEPELINELREEIFNGVAWLLNNDREQAEMVFDKVAHSLNSLIEQK